MTLWTVPHQVPLFMGFSRQEYWSGLPCPLPGDLPDPETEPVSLHYMRLGHHHEKSQNFCLQFVHNFCEFEKVVEESKEVFSNLMTLSAKLKLNLQEDNFVELLAVCHMRSLLVKT